MKFKKITFGLLVFLAIAGVSFAERLSVTYSEGKFIVPFGKSYNYADILVKKVIDGDTLILENGQRVRLIGIDTPEVHFSQKLRRDSRRSQTDMATIQKMGRLAWEFTRRLLEGKRVRLEFDVQRYDKYGRLLAYVYLKDGTFVNAEIIKEGYANLMTIPPNLRYVDLFREMYQKARESRKGLWK